MKYIFFLLLFNFLNSYGYCQKSNSKDSTLIEFIFSNPQPRINENISLNIRTAILIDTIFNSLPPADQMNVSKSYPNDLSIGYLKTDKIGKFKIGSMHFSMNGTNYYSKEMTYEVIDSLPETDKGLWIRAVKIDDSTFCLIIEQRIPKTGKEYYDSSKPNLVLYDVNLRNVAFYSSNINLTPMKGEGLSFSNDKKVGNGKRSYFQSSYISFIRILNRHVKITLTKDDFLNIPEDYIFQNIVIQ